MTFDDWQAHRTARSTRTLERRKLEAGFNAGIIRRHRTGETKKQIVAGLGISRELFNRVLRVAPTRRPIRSSICRLRTTASNQ